jgi:antitoxin HicB
MKKKVLSYQINRIPEDEGGFVVLVPALPGCVSYGRTVNEATEMAKEAIALHLENLRGHGQALPDEDARPVLNTTVNVAVSRA